MQKTKVKLWPLIIMLGLLATFASMNLVQDVEADIPVSKAYHATYSMPKISPDTTAAKTDGLDTGSLTPPFFFQGLGVYSDIEGYIYISGVTVDSGASASDTIDLSKDSVLYNMYSSYDYNRTVQHIIEAGSLISYTGGRNLDTVRFTLPPGAGTSGIGDNVFFNFDYAIADTDHSVARAAAGVIYTITVHMEAKL